MILEISAYLFNQKFETFSTCIYINIFKSFRNHFEFYQYMLNISLDSLYIRININIIVRKFYLYP